MRYLVALSLTVALFWSSSASALGEPSRVYKTVATTQVVDRGVGTLKTVKLLCPPGWLPTGYSLKPRRAGAVAEVGTTPIDRDGNRVDLSTSVLTFIDGYAIVVSNSNADEGEVFEFFITCVLGSAVFGDGTTWVRQTAMAPAGQVSSLVAFCPGGLTAIGAVNDAGQEGFLNLGYGMMWGTPSSPLFLGNQPDGPTTGATGWESTALNGTATAKPFSHWVICGTLPSATTYIYSRSVDSAAPIFAEWGAVPDNMYAISYGYDGFYYAANFSLYRYYADIWTADNVVAAQLQYYPGPGATYESSGRVLGFSGRIQPIAPKAVGVSGKATARVVFGITLIPATEAVPAPTIASVVEFYNSMLDHYFMTAVPKEMSDLDSGVHPGWARTGQSFNVYATGSSGHTGRHPVCRAYGHPSAGLDSHFYSASMEECYSTLSGFNGAWLLEATEIFQMDLPDPVTGACPSGDVPVYRVWNKRADSNHRYTTSIATRDQMVTMGYVAEGYGPNNVTLCALP